MAAVQTLKQRDKDVEEEERIRARAVVSLSDQEFATSINLLTVMSGVGGMEFSVVLPSLWQYVQRITPPDGGWWTPMHVQLVAVVMFYAATTSLKPLVGSLIDCGVSFRSCLRLAAICGSSGGLLYALAGDVDSALAVPLLLSARFMAGGGNTMSTIANLYTINAIKDPETKKHRLSLFAASTLVGVFVGPSVVPLFARVNVALGPLVLDECTLPGWFLLATFALLGSLQELYVREPPLAALAPGATLAGVALAGTSAEARRRGVCTWQLTLAFIYGTAFMFSINMFSIIAVLAVFTDATWGWGPVANAYLFLSLAGFTLMGILTSGELLRRGVPPLGMQAAAAALLLFHLLIITVWHAAIDELWSFLIWTGICGAAYSAMSASNVAAIASFAPRARMGLWVGLLGLADNLGSACAPLYIGLFGAGEAAGVREGLIVSRLPAIPLVALLLVGLTLVLRLGVANGEEEGQPKPSLSVLLPEDPWRYFKEDPNAVLLPVSSLVAAHVRVKATRRAAKFMRMAYDGEKERRDPISVAPLGDGRYSISDGNSTYASAVEAGWSRIVAIVSGASEEPEEPERNVRASHVKDPEAARTALL